MQNSVMTFNFSVFDQKKPLRDNLVQKFKIVMLTFSVFDEYILF